VLEPLCIEGDIAGLSLVERSLLLFVWRRINWEGGHMDDFLCGIGVKSDLSRKTQLCGVWDQREKPYRWTCVRTLLKKGIYCINFWSWYCVRGDLREELQGCRHNDPLWVKVVSSYIIHSLVLMYANEFLRFVRRFSGAYFVIVFSIKYINLVGTHKFRK